VNVKLVLIFGVGLFVGKKWYQIVLDELDKALDVLLGLIEGRSFIMKLEVTIIIDIVPGGYHKVDEYL
jgi:hypothetical protein